MNAQEKLLEEIERVTVIREHFRGLRGMPNVIVEPQIAMQTASIERAKKAAASNDAVQVLAALQDLGEYSE
jgi:hypothetical protein